MGGFWPVALSLLVGLSLQPARSQPAPSPLYVVDRFGTDEGIPGNQVYDIAQTADGYLWVATNGGLARFDGTRFEDMTARLRPALESAIITDLLVGRGDTLFAAAIGGPIRGSQVLAVADGAIRRYGPSLPANGNIGNLAQSGDGELLVTTDERLFVVSPSRIVSRRSRTPEGLRIRNLASDRRGGVWALLSGTPLAAPDGVESRCGSEYPAPWSFGRIGEAGPSRMGEAAYGHFVWSAAGRGVLQAQRTNRETRFATPSGQARGRFALPAGGCPILLGTDGVLWTQEGAALAGYGPRGTGAVTRLDLGLSLNAAPVGLEDRGGTLWVASTTQGLLRIRRNAFRVYALTDVPDEAPVSVYPGAGGSTLLMDVRWRVVRVTADGAVEPVRSGGAPLRAQGIYEDASGNRLYTLRVGSNETRIYRDTGGAPRLLVRFTQRNARNGTQFVPDPRGDGSVWFFEGQSLYRIADAMGPAPDATLVLDDAPPIRHLHIGRRGVLWVATEGGLVRVDGARRRLFTTADGLPHDHVRSVHEDADGVLWLGTYGGGIVRYRDGRFQTVTAADGLAENVVSSILEDDAGIFWMSGNRGVHRVGRADLNAFLDAPPDATSPPARVTSVLYGKESGLVNPEGMGSPALRAPDGRFWFPTFFGAGVVDPAAARRLDLAPPLAHVEAVTTADTTFRAARTLRLAAEQRRFSVGYVGLSLRHPQAVRYRYRLDGFDPDWVDAGALRQASYTNVPPGDYTFRVQAQSFGGVWSEADGLFSLSVAPFVYETGWFYALCALLLGGLVVGGVRVRERQLRANEAELNGIVRDRTEALQQEKETVAAQAEALRSLDAAKSRIFANISHEFRTPLTLIIGPLEDLQADLRLGAAGPSAERRVTAAIRNGRRLLRLVNQLLDVSRLEAGHVELAVADTDLAALVGHIAAAFEPLAERSGSTLQVDAAPVRMALDPEQIEKVLVNLLGNAFKFSPDGSTIAVSLREAPDGGALVTVRDDGPGIDLADQDRVFDRFVQGDASSTRLQAGTGIGLALARGIAERHGGTLTLQSTLDEGSTFTLRLPPGLDVTVGPVEPSVWQDPSDSAVADYYDLEPAGPRADPGPDADGPTVLVVDDNAEVRAYIREHLAARYRIVEAADGAQALALARAAPPDLVVSDVMMPELDGFGLCRAIREDPELDFVPVVLLTARASVDSKLEGLGLGADDYLTKPFDVRELEVRVENLIASRQRLKAHVAAGLPADVPAPDLDPFLAEVRAAITARLADDDFGVDALAAGLGLGRSTLYRRLAEAGGGSPMDLVWQMRLETAADLLRQRSGSVGEVAYGVGFKSVAHFCTRFLEAYGVTPASYAPEPPA